MKIQSLFGYHEVYMGGVTYQFCEENDYTCDVVDTASQDRFLACPLDYREVPDKSAAEVPVQEGSPQDSVPEVPKIKPLRRPRQPRQRFSPENRPTLMAD